MALLINIPNRKLGRLVEKLKELLPQEDIWVWPEVPEPSRVDFALVWKHEHGSLSDLPNLKGISSFGAGVDSILSDPMLPNVPIARIVDDNLANSMSQYVLSKILSHKQRHTQYAKQQQACEWKAKSPRKENHILILGAGQLGLRVAKDLTNLSFDVSIWSNSKKEVTNITSLIGQQALKDVLPSVDYLVCLLPLTLETKGIMNIDVFEALPDHAVVINVARGEHVVEQDLLFALKNNLIEHAILDVFCQEPLPSNHPYWIERNITITPHVSAVTNIDTAVQQIAENYKRVVTNEDMLHLINVKRGY